MSASNHKKLRKEKYMTERQRREAEEQKKLKRYTLTFWIVMALCVCTILTAVLYNPVRNIYYRNTTAITVGDHDLSAVEVNYFYIDAINTYCNQYSYYISYLIDVQSPLNAASNTDSTGATWADKFLDMAIENIKTTYQLYDLAKQNGFQLSEEEQKGIDTMMSNLDVYAKYYGYSDADSYLTSTYGPGSNVDTYRAYYEVCTIADCYYTEYAESLEYDDTALRNYEADKIWQYSSYTYSYYYFNASTFLKGGTKGEDGKITYSDDEKAAAVATAKALAEKLLEGKYETLEDFDKAINAILVAYDEANKPAVDNSNNTTTDETTKDETTKDETTDGDKTEEEEEKLKYTSTKEEDILYSKLRALFADWLRGKETSEDDKTEGEDKDETLVVRKDGDLTLIVNESGSGDSKTTNGFYVLRFGSINDNQFKLKNVRHLLVAFQGGKTDANGNKTYTETEKDTAKKAAWELMAEFEKTDMTEEDFAKLANQNSDDGDGTTGGLYENIYPGQMVEEFEKWCYQADRKAGDYGIIQTEYGYHVMYYVGDSEYTYRDYMVENDLRSKDVTEWLEALVKAAVLEEKNLKLVDRELVLSGN